MFSWWLPWILGVVHKTWKLWDRFFTSRVVTWWPFRGWNWTGIFRTSRWRLSCITLDLSGFLQSNVYIYIVRIYIYIYTRIYVLPPGTYLYMQFENVSEICIGWQKSGVRMWCSGNFEHVSDIGRWWSWSDVGGFGRCMKRSVPSCL